MRPWSGKHHQSLDDDDEDSENDDDDSIVLASEVLPGYYHGAQTSGGGFQPPYQHGAQTFSSGVQPPSGHTPIFLPRPVPGCTIPNATPLTNYPIPNPISLADYYDIKRREELYQQKQRKAELAKRMLLDSPHSALMKREAELSERMKLHADVSEITRLHAEAARRARESKLSERMQLDGELSERGRLSPEPRDPRRSLSPIPGFEMESRENEYDNRSTTIGAATNSAVKRPTHQDSMYKFNSEDPSEITRSTRKDPPTHYQFTISSFRTLRESMLRGSCEPDYIESTEFYAANFRWLLLIYPNGNLKQRGKDHLSLYLKIVTQLDQRFSVKATLKFFIYNFHEKAYLIIEGKDETYDVENRQQGIAKALPLAYLEDPTFGFMEDESCRVGIEVIIANRVDSDGTRFGHLFIPRGRWKQSATWEVHDYSEVLRDNNATSEKIKMCERRWHCNLVETSRQKEKVPAGFSDGVWSKTYSRVPETNNGGDATPDGSNLGDFEVCNNEPKSPISEGSRGTQKASKSFKECGGISQGELNVDCALKEEGKRKESTRQKRSDTRGCLTTPDAVTRKETEVLAGSKIDNGPLLGPKSLEGPDSVSTTHRDGDSTSL
ncbi:hypothetical protein Ancab_039252 [Ancistrocladus abbreviatus]